MNERLYNAGVDRLRAPERIARLEVDRVVSLAIEGIQPSTVLDVGTGSGIFAEAFAKAGLTPSGVDLKPEMIQAAQRYVPSGNFKIGTAERLPFPGQSHDIVFLGLVLHEADDALKALQEAHRVARMRSVILEWPYIEEEFGPPLQHRLSTSQITELATQAGFLRIEILRLHYLILYRIY